MPEQRPEEPQPLRHGAYRILRAAAGAFAAFIIAGAFSRRQRQGAVTMIGKAEQAHDGAGVHRPRILPQGLWGLGVAAASVLYLQSAWAEETRTPSGKVYIEQVQIALIGSGNLGGGTLEFDGKKYPFTIGGLGIGGIGISKMTATGEVYDLKSADDFPGAYVQGRYGAVAGDHDTGELWLENAAGVSLHLATEREGLALSLGADAIYIDFDD